MIQLNPPDGDESNRALVELIASEIEAGGPMTFARFMELAVGHPQYGYYASSVERVGRDGDFLTAPETHPVFGWLLARQIVECWELLGGSATLTVREFGAGRGTLARQILGSMREMSPAGLESVSYELRDLNPDHLASVDDKDSGFVGGPHSVVPASANPITGVMIANEYFDALPFHRLEFSQGALRERYVDLRDGWFVEVTGPPSDAVRALKLDETVLVDGQAFEASPPVRQAVVELGGQLERGFALLIDYGYEREALYNVKRFPAGSLKTYRQHEVGDDPYSHIGQQDITAHVDFTLVAEAAVEAGLTTVGTTTLAEFCAGLGLDEVLMEIQATDADAYLAARTAALTLLDPTGMGRFKVAVLARGILDNCDLRGLSFRMPGL